MATLNDPSVCFEPVAVDVELAGCVFTIPPLPASWWLTVLSSDELTPLDVIPGLLGPEDQAAVDDLVFEGRLAPGEITSVFYETIEAVSGHRWWWTLRIIGCLKGQHATEFMGEMARYDASSISIGLWLSAAYALLVRNQKEEDRVKLDMALDAPPEGVEVQFTEADEKAAEQAFFAMLNQK